MSNFHSNGSSSHGSSQPVAPSRGGGEPVRDFDRMSTAYSVLSYRTESTTLPQDKFYHNLVGIFKECVDRDLLEKQIVEVKGIWNRKIEKWESCKQQLTRLNPTDPLIKTVERRINKGRNLCESWTGELFDILRGVMCKEIGDGDEEEEEEEEEEDRFHDSHEFITIDDDNEYDLNVESADRHRQTEDWVRNPANSPEESDLIIPLTQETAECSTPIPNSLGTGPAGIFEKSAERTITLTQEMEVAPSTQPNPEETIHPYSFPEMNEPRMIIPNTVDTAKDGHWLTFTNDPLPITSIFEENSESTVPVTIPSKSSRAPKLKKSAAQQNVVPPEYQETRSLIEILDEFMDQPVKDFRQAKLRSINPYVRQSLSLKRIQIPSAKEFKIIRRPSQNSKRKSADIKGMMSSLRKTEKSLKKKFKSSSPF